MNIYEDIELRTGGDIFIGVVGPVRSGKSTFIKNFMDSVIIPNILDPMQKERSKDELPQSSGGRTIMTTEPKFIPEQAVKVGFGENIEMNVRMIDCVGFIMPSAIGYIEENEPRMVRTPWYDDPIPFNMAAELGTRKVITEHSTIGIVITSDGSIGDIERDEYEEAEERVIHELKESGKPYIIILNSSHANDDTVKKAALSLEEKYHAPVLALNCLTLSEENVVDIFEKLLYMFPISEISISAPDWVLSLKDEHELKKSLLNIASSFISISRLCEVSSSAQKNNTASINLKLESVELATGKCKISAETSEQVFMDVFNEVTGLNLLNRSDMFIKLTEMSEKNKRYSKLVEAWDEVNDKGYGIVMPDVTDLSFETPEIMRQSGKYGIKLKATAPSVHMIKTNICAEITPIVGSEQQSEELIAYLLSEFEEDPEKIWDSNILGKSLHELISEGMNNKLSRMPEDARIKVRETMERIINEGCNGLICIIL